MYGARWVTNSRLLAMACVCAQADAAAISLTHAAGTCGTPGFLSRKRLRRRHTVRRRPRQIRCALLNHLLNRRKRGRKTWNRLVGLLEIQCSGQVADGGAAPRA